MRRSRVERRAELHRQRTLAVIAVVCVALIAGLAVGLLSCGSGMERPGDPPLGYLRDPLGGRSWRVAAWTLGGSASLDAAIAAGAIDEVDFDWYLSRADGSITSSGEDLDLVARARDHDLNLFATVTNRPGSTSAFSRDVARAILATEATRATYVDSLVALVKRGGYDGIDLDWEEMTLAERGSFTKLVEEAASALHGEDRFLSVTVYPKTSEPGTTPGQLSEDYAAIGSAADEFKIMTYGRSGVWSSAGPQAQLSWLDQVLRFAEKKVEPGKICMGVAFFGFDWGGGHVSAVTGRSAAESVAASSAKAVRDAQSAEMVLRRTDTAGASHTMYYPDARTIAARLRVVRRRHPEIGGAAIWLMGQEGPGFWSAMSRTFASPE